MSVGTLVTSTAPQRHYIFNGLITYHLRQADCTVATHKNVPLMVSVPYFLVFFGNLPTLPQFIFCKISYFLVRWNLKRKNKLETSRFENFEKDLIAVND